MTETEITLELVAEKFAVCRLPEGAAVPPADSSYLFWARTPEETSLVCPEDDLPPDAEKSRTGMRCLRVAGVLDLSLIGILARLTAVLAEAQVPVFALSTWDTDYLLIPDRQLGAARAALAAVGIPVRDAQHADKSEGS